ncbi:type VII secretion integral membrane protein EccD [Nocardia sp. SSK8]|uniref:type VII secretion integral membrane protein EccD n=1 Tax=Nocardia sp. SSK8 TaxID=3120154 RepID=UPI00300B7289
MSAHFVRVSVVSGDSQLDVSLPARRPLAEYITDVTELLAIEPGDPVSAWALSAPARGTLAMEASLAESGVRDGAVLHLTPVELAAHTPFVDDVVDAVEAAVDRDGRRFGDASRDRAVVALVVLTCAGAAILGAGLRPGALGAPALIVLAAAIAVAAAVLNSPARSGLAWGLVPLVGTAAICAVPADPALMVSAGASGAFAGAALAAALSTRRTGHVVGAAGAAAGFAAVAAAVASGANITAMSAWIAPVLVALIAVVPRGAVLGSGLLDLVRRGEQGDPVPRATIDAGTRRGRDLLDVGVGALALAISAAVVTLIWTGIWVQVALGVLIGVVVLLRSRAYTDVWHVGALLAVPVLATLATGAVLAREIAGQDPVVRSIVLSAVAAAVVLTLVVAGFVRLGEVAAARVARLWNALDPVLLVLLLPATFGAQGVYTYLW